MNSVTIHGVLALAGLAFAYQTYNREAEQEEQPGQVTLLECEPQNLNKLELESATQLLTVEPKKSGDKVEYWLTTTRRKRPEEQKAEDKKPAEPKAEDKKADDKTAENAKAADAKPNDKKAEDKKAAEAKPDDKAAQKPGEKKEDNAMAAAEKPADADKPARANDPDAPVTFLGNQKFEDTLKLLAPLRAMRGLGEIKKERYEQFGFDKIDTRFRMECGGRKIELEVGGRTFGAGDRYTRDAKTKQSYLVSGQLLTDLESARYKFMQNDLNTSPMTEVDQAIVKAAGKERKLVQRNRSGGTDARWVDAATPDKRNELFNTWFQRLSRLKVRAYLPAGAEPGSDLQVEATGTTPVVSIEYALEGKPKGKIEIVRVDTKKEALFYARSDATKRWVSVYDSLAKQVEEDVALVVGVEEIPPELQKRMENKPAAAPAQLPSGHPPL